VLTESKIKAMLPKQRPDGTWKPVLALDQAGLYIQISMGKDGVNRSWVYRYSLGSKSTTVGLGRHPDISLAQARDLAAKQRALRAEGKDPLLVKREARAELLAKIKVEAAPKPETRTFAHCTQAYIAEHKSGWKNPKSESAWRGSLTAYALPILGNKDMRDITTDDVFECVRPIWLSKHTTASNVRSRIECIIDWATAKKYRKGDNPAAWTIMQHLLPDASKVKIEHHAALHYTEIASFMADVAAVDSLPAKALRFCILTATRADETRCARWREIDLNARLWTIPDNRMKAGQAHQCPISDAAMEILASLRTETTEPNDFVFAMPHGQPFAENAMLNLAKKLRPNTKLTVHGMRSCFRDWCGDCTDTPREIAEQALAHVVGGVEGAYRRGSAIEKRRQLMAQWSAHCGSADVIPFRREGDIIPRVEAA
jgi:integrase